VTFASTFALPLSFSFFFALPFGLIDSAPAACQRAWTIVAAPLPTSPDNLASRRELFESDPDLTSPPDATVQADPVFGGGLARGESRLRPQA
jgi:hypothetical protein